MWMVIPEESLPPFEAPETMAQRCQDMQRWAEQNPSSHGEPLGATSWISQPRNGYVAVVASLFFGKWGGTVDASARVVNRLFDVARSSGFTESVTPAKLAVMMGRCWKNEELAGCFSSPHTDRWKRGNRKTLRPLTGVLKLVHCLKVTWDAKLVWHIKLAPPFSPHDTSHLEVS